MIIPITLIAQFLGMFTAVKVFKINVNIGGVILLTFIPIALSTFVPGLLGFGLALLSLFWLVKVYDGSASFIKIIGILVISAATQMVIFKYVVTPVVVNSLNNAESVSIKKNQKFMS